MSTIIVTPVGEAIFPNLNNPNENFEGQSFYSVNVRLTEEEAAKLSEQIKNECAADFAKLELANKIKTPKYTFPWKAALDRDKNPIAGIDFKIKQNSEFGKAPNIKKFVPKLYDLQNRPWDLEKIIGFGSQVKVAFRPSAYYVKGELGITLRLVAVQVVAWHDAAPSPDDMFGAPAASEDMSGTSEADSDAAAAKMLAEIAKKK